MIGHDAYRKQAQSPDELVEKHMDIVRRQAWHFHGRTGRFIDIEDLLQAGYLGLIDASRRYTTREGVTFGAYANIRVRGSIIDYLRRNSNMCRNTINMQKRVKQAQLELERNLQRSPTSTEVAEHMDMDIVEYEDWQTRFQANRVRSLDEVYTDHSMLFRDHALTAEDETHHSELRELLKKALQTLPQREALVLQLYYVEELNVYEVAAILDITTGRVSQIKKAAIEKLRDQIAPQT